MTSGEMRMVRSDAARRSGRVEPDHQNIVIGKAAGTVGSAASRRCAASR
jgi:hypothetical protein